MNVLEYIESHPAVAFVVGGSHLALAESLNHFVIPGIFMQIFQVGAWSVTITVGVVSLYGTWKKRQK